MLNGYKTYSGLAIALLGILGLGNIITIEELNRTVDLVIALSGIILAVYGRYKTHKINY